MSEKKATPRTAGDGGRLCIEGARVNNLKNINVEIRF